MAAESVGVDLSPNDSVPQSSTADETARYVNNLFKKALKVCRKQHDCFKEMDKQVAGDQWDPEDIAKLKSENRPVGVFNFIKRHVNVVCGTEILNRLQPIFLPRVIDSAQAEQLAALDTGCYEYVMENCDGIFEISSTFHDEVSRGLGFFKARLDMITEPGGKVTWERIDGLYMVWDPDSMGKQNLEGARYFIYFSRMPKDEAVAEWPDEEDYIKSPRPSDYDDQFGVSAKVEQVVPPPYDPLNKYETDAIDSSGRDHVIIKEAYYYIDENWTEYIDPFNKEKGIQEMLTKDFRRFKREYEKEYEGEQVESAPRQKRIWKRAFVIGERTMEETDAPMQLGSGCIKVMSGEWDPAEKVYRGLPYVLKDPQQYLNKYLSQSVHSIATAPKGILLFEDGAFTNYAMAEEQWASWAPFIPMAQGAMGGTGGSPKFQYLPPAQPPQILFEMWQACVKVIEQIAGINLEMLGGGEGEVPGITMRQRQAVAMIAMAGFFNSYRRFLKGVAVTTLEMVRKFYTDDRVIRIGGGANAYESQGIKLEHDDLSYPCDIRIDESPSNPNTQDMYWEKAAPIVPGLFKSGAIMQVPSITDILPLPPKSKAELKKWIMAMGQQIAQAGGTPGQQGGQKGKGQQGKPSRDDPQLIQGKIEHQKAKTQETIARAKALDADMRLKQVKALTSMMDVQREGRQSSESHALDLMLGVQNLHHTHQRHHVEQRQALIDAANAIRQGQQIGAEGAEG